MRYITLAGKRLKQNSGGDSYDLYRRNITEIKNIIKGYPVRRINMKKTCNIEVDCAVCAMKCEEAIKKVEGVKDCKINFIAQKMTVEADDYAAVSKNILKAAKKVEPDFEIED